MTKLALIVKRMAPGPTALQSMALWGTCAGVTALWLTQPFDYIKKQFSGEPAAEAE